MKITIIFPPYKHKNFSENPKVVDDEFGVYPPLIPAYIAALLEKHNHKVSFIDAHASKLGKDEVLAIVNDFSPDFLLFNLNSNYTFHDTFEYIKFLKDMLNIPVLVGGFLVNLYTNEVMSYKEIDFGMVGDPINSLPQFLTYFSSNENYKNIPGLCFKENGGIKINSPVDLDFDLDKYPFPARHLLPNEKYYQFISKRKNFTIMLGSVGCPYPCTFCAIGKRSYRVRSIKSIVDEIEECYNNVNVREIDFFDAVFTLNKKRIFELCKEIKNRNLEFDWSCRSRVDNVDEELLKEMASAGCKRIYYGIESSNPKILDSVKKEINPSQVQKVIELTKKYGIKALGFFMIGNPIATYE